MLYYTSGLCNLISYLVTYSIEYVCSLLWETTYLKGVLYISQTFIYFHSTAGSEVRLVIPLSNIDGMSKVEREIVNGTCFQGLGEDVPGLEERETGRERERERERGLPHHVYIRIIPLNRH